MIILLVIPSPNSGSNSNIHRSNKQIVNVTCMKTSGPNEFNAVYVNSFQNTNVMLNRNKTTLK